MHQMNLDLSSDALQECPVSLSLVTQLLKAWEVTLKWPVFAVLQ